MPVIKRIITNDAGVRPVLVEFQNGKVQPSEEHSLDSGLYKTKDGTSVVGITSDKMLYTGEIDNENDLYNHFILVHNRKKDKVRLIQIDCCTVSPVIDKKKLVSTRITESSIAELNKSFGSKRKKRYTEQQERLVMNIDAVKEQLEKTVADIKVDDANLNNQPSENDSSYRPRINREASTKEQVYNLEELVPEQVLHTLYTNSEKILTSENFEQFGLTSFCSSNISKILASPSSEDIKRHRISIFLYIHYVIKFMNTPIRQITTKKFVACDVSADVNNHILNNYSFNTGNHRTRPLSMKDKSLCFILVLSAIATDYEFDVEMLTKDLKVGLKKALEISRLLAFSTSAKSTIITLKFPLPAPISISPKRRRK